MLGGAPPAPPAMGPRRRGGPSRRRALIALVVAVAAIGGLIAAVQLTSSAARTVVPELRRLPRGGVEARARRLHVRPVFSARHSETPDGIAIAQSPRPGRHVDQGSTVEVVLSSGPPPVPVPGVVGKAASTAETTIADAGLRYSLTRVPAPGSMPGTVVRQSPAAPTSAPRGSTVGLSIAETPEWRTLTSFSGVDDGSSVPFRILGDRWRVVYDMSFEGTCLLLVICDGPSAQASSLSGGGSGGSFDLGDGEDQSHVFTSGPGPLPAGALRRPGLGALDDARAGLLLRARRDRRRPLFAGEPALEREDVRHVLFGVRVPAVFADRFDALVVARDGAGRIASRFVQELPEQQHAAAHVRGRRGGLQRRFPARFSRCSSTSRG